MNTEINIRFAKIEDLPLLVDIYNQAIKSKKSTGDLHQYTIDERLDWFKKFDSQKFPLYVLELNGHVVAYCSLSPYRPGRKAMAHIAEISYYLDFKYHQQGLGTTLLEHVIADCPRLGVKNLLAILLDINTSSIALLNKLQFKKWGHLPKIVQMDNYTCGQFVFGLKIEE